jgi:enoyl-CoA hydratase
VTLIRTQVDGGTATVTLSDPARRNALSRELVGELVAAFDTLEADPDVRAVVVTGAPPAFCSGAARDDLAGADADRLGAIYEGFLRIARCPLPTVAAVNGPAVGAGFNLALACDIRLAGAAARFDARFLRLGIHPGGGHTWMLRRAVGPQAAAAIVLFGQVLSGVQAERAGLVWRCVPDGDLMAEARELASGVAGVRPELARRAKATLRATSTMDSHDDAVALELEAQLWSLR